MHKRYACKLFDDTKKVSKEDRDFILEVGRLSPSSFGMEHWKFLVISKDELKLKLRPFCWDQKQLTTCSFVVVILAKKDILKAGSDYTNMMLARRGLPQEMYQGYLEKYKDFMSSKDDREVVSWSHRQCYISAANMCTMATSIGIDNCMIEGFEKDNVEELLNIDQTKFDLSLIITFGYRKKDITSKMRLPFDEVVEFLD
jgi:nitroreductase